MIFVIFFLAFTFCQVAICVGPPDGASYKACIDCYMFFGCECGDEGLEKISDCIEVVHNKTKGLIVQRLNLYEICEFDFPIEGWDYEYLQSLACAKDKQVLDSCTQLLAKDGKKYMEDLSTSDKPEDKEELKALMEAYECLQPPLNMCRMLPGECEI